MILNTLITNTFTNDSNTISYLTNKSINVKLKEITKYTDKIKWNRLFAKSYSGGLLNLSIEQLSKGAIFLVACDGDREIGYMRLTRQSEYEEFGAEPNVFCVSEAFVKPFYRSKGILRQMLAQAVENYNVKSILLEQERALKNQKYYSELGFTVGVAFFDDSLMYLFQTDFESYVAKEHAESMKLSNDSLYAKAA